MFLARLAMRPGVAARDRGYGASSSGGVGRGFARAPELNVEIKGTTYRMGTPVREAGTATMRLAALHATSRVGENGDRDG